MFTQERALSRDSMVFENFCRGLSAFSLPDNNVIEGFRDSSAAQLAAPDPKVFSIARRAANRMRSKFFSTVFSPFPAEIFHLALSEEFWQRHLCPGWSSMNASPRAHWSGIYGLK